MEQNKIPETRDFSFLELFESLPAKKQRKVREGLQLYNNWSKTTYYNKLNVVRPLTAIEAVRTLGVFQQEGINASWVNGVLKCVEND